MLLTNSDKNITIEEIEKIEKELDIIFPSELKKFYLKYNGGESNKKYFNIKNLMSNYQITFFKPMLKEQMLKGEMTISIYKHYILGIEKKYLISNLIPFADDLFGNFLCIDKYGKIYYYAMDMWSFDISLEYNLKENLYLLANSFNEFLDMLTEEPNPEFEDEE